MRGKFLPGVMFIAACVLVTGPALAGDASYTMTMSEERGFVDGTATAVITLDNEDGDELAGYSIAVCHDGEFATLSEEDVVNGATPDENDYLFHSFRVRDDEYGTGFTLGAALSIGTDLANAPDHELYLVTYELVAIGETSLEFCSLASPAVTTTVVTSVLVQIDEGDDLVLVDGAIEIGEQSFSPFLRGDANDDGRVSISDAFQILNTIFNQEPVACRAACNVDAEDDIDVRDAITLLTYLYLEGPKPAMPFPTCGNAEDDDGEEVESDCEVSASCE